MNSAVRFRGGDLWAWGSWEGWLGVREGALDDPEHSGSSRVAYMRTAAAKDPKDTMFFYFF